MGPPNRHPWGNKMVLYNPKFLGGEKGFTLVLIKGGLRDETAVRMQNKGKAKCESYRASKPHTEDIQQTETSWSSIRLEASQRLKAKIAEPSGQGRT